MRKSWTIRKDAKAVSPVIATILMVAITVVLAAVLYVMVTGFLNPGASTKPNVFINTPTALAPASGFGFTFGVSSVSEQKPIANYKVNFFVGSTGSTSGAITMTASMSFTVSGTVYTVAFTDAAGEGSLTGGDSFTATKPTALTSGTVYHVLLFWGATNDQIFDAAFTA